MEKQVKISTSGGIGFSGMLTILFIALKLLGKISWSWLWVLSPLWISWGLILFIFIIVCLIIPIISYIICR